MAILVSAPPCVLLEDEHILVVNKPPGLNTHSPTPYAGEGIYEWLKNREPRWASLATIHRLDKSTSGVMVFAKSKLANQSLTEQFAQRRVRKRYLLLTPNGPARQRFHVSGGLVRIGDKYKIDPAGAPAETNFSYLGRRENFHLFAAEPLTGRTHQIRVHAAENGIPILGDALYGGRPFQRVCLHAEQLQFVHPQTGVEVVVRAPADFFETQALALRRLVIQPEQTNAYRVVHGASDGAPVFLERWGGFVLAQSQASLSVPQREFAETVRDMLGSAGLYHKLLNPEVGKASQGEAAPKLVAGTAAPAVFPVLENGLRFEISFEQGYSVGLFLDQRENRRRLLTKYISPGFELFAGARAPEVLNAFAYTCGFSVCAAASGARTTSLDLSRKYLDWGQRNFMLNGLNPGGHKFIYGDVFDWLSRFRKQERRFDLILLDPPTFSRSKEGIFQAERDFGRLVSAALPLLAPGGVLFASTNSHKLAPEKFIRQVQESVTHAGRRIEKQQYVPQPIDFPVSREVPAYLKTAWLQIC